MNNSTNFYNSHQVITLGDFWQIDVCRGPDTHNYVDMVFSSFADKKKDELCCSFSTFDFVILSDLLPKDIKNDLMNFMEKKIHPHSIENLVFLFSLDNDLSFFHRKFMCHMQNNGSFFEARKNIVIPETHNLQNKRYKIASKSFTAGKYRVAFSPRAACFLVHELFGHVFENHQLLSFFLERGFKCPKGFYLYDDPTLQYRYGSYEFDASFNKSRRCECICNGEILSAFDTLGDILISQRVEDWAKKPEGRMSNIILNIDEQKSKDIFVDLYVEDCFEGNEATFDSDVLTLKTRSCLSSDGELFEGTVVFLLNIFDFYHKYVSSFSAPCQRAIDCFKPQSGWIRTSAESPGIILEDIYAHSE